MQSDRVVLSATNKIKTNKPVEKKEGLSKGAKCLLGIAGTAATVYGAVVLHRHMTKPTIEKVQKNFSEIFRRDISKEEAQKMVERYKEIFEIKDEKKFRDTVFNQLKKDYGLEKTSYGLTVEKMQSGLQGKFSPFGKINLTTGKDGMTNISFDNNYCVSVNELSAKSRTSFFETLVHELNHAKQFEISYRTNADEALNAYFVKWKDELPFIENLKKEGYDIIADCKKLLVEFVGNTKPSSLVKGSKEYELGLKYIENQKNYISSQKDMDGYVKQIVEEESFGVEKLMRQVENSFMSIWRI